MLFRQLFESVSCTYTYLLAAGPGSEAIIIDPVAEKLDRYLQLFEELDLKLAIAVDTHVHADHISGLGVLRDATRCVTAIGEQAQVDVVSLRLSDGDVMEVEGICLEALYTPGHTDDSYCFRLPDRIFTGDTLLIRGSGRTDFQNGDSRAAYRSIRDKILSLPDETLIYPGHDYKGDTVSTVAEEKAHNPRLQVDTAEAYAEIMDNLGLPNPKMMDVAVPANLTMGLAADKRDAVGVTVSAGDAVKRLNSPDLLFIDLRETTEREKEGVIPGSVHVPYLKLSEFTKSGGLLQALAQQSDRELLVYCAYGERSALALETMKEAGIRNARHLGGGIDAWRQAGGTLEAPPQEG